MATAPDWAATPKRSSEHFKAPTRIIVVKRTRPKRILRVPEDHASIQAAIDAAEKHDVIAIASGEYVGGIRLKDDLTLCAKEPEAVRLTGPVCFANGVRLINLVFSAPIGTRRGIGGPPRDPSDEHPGRPTCWESVGHTFRGVEFLFCRFEGSSREDSNCLLRMGDVKGLKIIGCVLCGAHKHGHGEMYGLHLQNCHDVTVSANTVAGLHETDWGNTAGIVAEYCSGEISNNVVTELSEKKWDSAYGIWIKCPRGLRVQFNTVRNVASDDWDSTFGICVNGEGSATVRGNLVHNLFGKGWTDPIYGIFSDARDVRVFQNNVSNLFTVRREPAFDFEGPGVGRNMTVTPTFHDASFRLSGPSTLLSKGKDAVGVFAGEPVVVSIPDLNGAQAVGERTEKDIRTSEAERPASAKTASGVSESQRNTTGRAHTSEESPLPPSHVTPGVLQHGVPDLQSLCEWERIELEPRAPDSQRPRKLFNAPLEMVRFERTPSEHVLRVPEEHRDIHAAIAASQKGDTIVVAPGDYGGHITLKDGVALVAEKPESVFLTGTMRLAGDVRLINLVFRGVSFVQEPAIQESTSHAYENVDILLCRFQGKSTVDPAVARTRREKGGACLLRLCGISGLRIVGCVFSYASVENGELYGLHLENCNNVLVCANFIGDLAELEHGHGNVAGLVVESCSGDVCHNAIAELAETAWSSAYGIWVKHPRGLRVSHNTIRGISNGDWDSTYGICVNGSGELVASYNLIDNLHGEGWTAPIYGIYSDAKAAQVTDNNVSNLTMSRRKPPQAYAGVGGAQNGMVTPRFQAASFHLAGPKELLEDGKDAVGVFSGDIVNVPLPDIVGPPTTEQSAVNAANPRDEDPSAD